MMSQAVLVIHGGAGARASGRRLTQIRQHLRTICDEAYAQLRSYSARDAVVFAVERLEDDPLFNAGTGSALQQDGVARMSASIMDGASRRFAAVLNIERVRHPVRVAERLLKKSDRVLAGREATRFARSQGMPAWNPVMPERWRQWRSRRRGQYGTVGAVALDARGRLAAATSTGGKGFERPGRVSDSGLPVGNYANDRVAISCTGIGEDIMEEGLAVQFAQRVADGASLRRAVTRTAHELTQHHRRLGFIAVDWQGHYTWCPTLPVLCAVARTPTRRVDSF